MMQIGSQYLEFELVEKKTKTSVYEVRAKKDGSLLGVIKWWTRWRQYCFFPTEETVWNPGCLSDVILFINELMEKRRPRF